MLSALTTDLASGSGRSLAIHLAANGWDVFAGFCADGEATTITADHPNSPVIFDITDANHVVALYDLLPKSLDAVGNNAGAIAGVLLEALSLAELRRQFEVNVISQIAVTQTVLPRLWRARVQIVLISNLIGKVALPLIGSYCASRFTLEAAGDVLSMGLKQWNTVTFLIEV
ncbi:SDR family NAD(P)-dependent oxidoreductase [Mycobacterium uberis]|uniref:SDR family NAD(P)-dependent oxidoreductase n=1 Tax=Mycobacterium uberis TaxID=2162698 RepID=UPI0014038FA2|nr:SDR family NAD(P)-dependent oxidoreductase [Mycobacterium uberis]